MALPPGPQYHPPECIFWNTLESTAHVNYSAAGPNGTVIGPVTYVPAQFDNGARIDANGEALDFIDSYDRLFGARGCAEFWTKTDWNCTNGLSGDGATHKYLYGHQVTGGGDQNAEMNIQGGGVLWGFRHNGVWAYGALGPVAGMTWLAGTLVHIAFVWDQTGIGGSANTYRIYFNGAQIHSSNNAFTPPAFSPGPTVAIGNDQDQGRIHPIDAVVDNFKIWDYAKTDFSDRFTEGFAPSGPTLDPAPKLIDIKVPRVEMDGVDIGCKINDTPVFTERRGIGADKVWPDDCKITVENFDQSFSLQHPRSFFAGDGWQNKLVEVWDRENLKIWSGVLSSPQVDHKKKTTDIVSKSNLHEWRNATVAYTTTGWETPADALDNIATAIGFPYLDAVEIARSSAGQTADGLSIKVTLVDADNAKFCDVLNSLADYGCADVYEHVGKLLYRYEPGSAPTPDVTLEECDVIAGTMKVTRTTKTLFNDYAIYEQNTASTVTDSGAGDIGAQSRLRNGTFLLERVPGTSDAKYQVENVISATAIGEAYIRRTHVPDLTRPRIQIQFDVETYHRTWVDLTTDFRITYSREGWTDKIFRVVGFTRDDNKRRITVTALEWPE